jgi:mono/diheme cytochrome c family protein
MRRVTLLAIPAVLVLAGCGGTTVQPVAQTVVGSLPTTSTTAGPVLPKGNAAAGEAIFTQNCSGCHTLVKAGAKGAVGPNLDQVKPDLALIETRVLNGSGAMPPFKGVLTQQQIADVAQFVYDATHGG